MKMLIVNPDGTLDGVRGAAVDQITAQLKEGQRGYVIDDHMGYIDCDALTVVDNVLTAIHPILEIQYDGYDLGHEPYVK